MYDLREVNPLRWRSGVRFTEPFVACTTIIGGGTGSAGAVLGVPGVTGAHHLDLLQAVRDHLQTALPGMCKHTGNG